MLDCWYVCSVIRRACIPSSFEPTHSSCAVKRLETFMDIDLSIALILGMVALLAGFFDAIVGGGGLLTLPALFVAGLDPLSAMATNKLQASCASVSATAAFARRGMIDWRADAGPAIASCMAGAAGALSISMIPRGVLQAAIPLLLLAVAAYFALSPKVDERPRKSRISRYAFMLAVVPIIGFYDGVFGPGTGSFFMIAFMLLLAQPLLTAVCRSKLLNAACNVSALSVFMLNGAVLWPLALIMSVAAITGAQLGARCALRFGTHLIKPVVIIVCCLMALKLLWSAEHPVRLWIEALPG